MIGNILYEHDNHGIALSYYKKALALNPKEFRALICLGNAKYDKGVSIIHILIPNILKIVCLII
jgi:hypothetical protein